MPRVVPVTVSARPDGVHPELPRDGTPLPVPTMGPVSRLAAAALVALTLLGLAVALVADLVVLRQATATVFLLLELGVAPALLARPLRASRFTLVALVGGLVAAVLTGITMATLHVWVPVPAAVVVATATVVMLVVAVRRDLRALRDGRLPQAPAVEVPRPGDQAPDPRALDRRALDPEAPAEARAASTARLPLVPLATVAGVALVVVASLLVRGDPPPGGLLSIEGPLWWAGLVLLVAAAVVAVVSRRSPALPLMSLSGVAVLSQAIAYGTPTMVSAARHVGVVESIRANGGTSTGVDIFQSWSGLFAAVAWAADVAGLRDVMVVATWWPVMISPLITLAATVLAARFLTDDGRAWIAGGLFGLTLTLNTLYFSPQSLGVVLSLSVFALALSGRPPISGARRRSRPASVAPWRLAAVLVLGCALAVTHQISPYLTTAALVVFVAFRLIRPWWLPTLVLVPAVLWALSNASVLGAFLLPTAFGDVVSNAAPPAHSAATLPVPVVKTLAFTLPAAVLVLLGLVALVTVVLRRGDRRAWALAVAAVSPVSLVVATNYGAEGIFRVTLFAAPWLSVLAASLPWHRLLPRLARSSARARRRAAVVVTSVALVVVVGVNVFGATALDWNRVASADTTRVTARYEETAAAGAALLVPGTGNATPGARTARYDQVQYLTREALGGWPDTSSYDAAADEARLTSGLEAWDATERWVLVSDVVGAYDDRYGFQSYDDYTELAAAFAADDRWEAVMTTPTATLYRLSTTGAGDE
ncbi:hypothetical protein F1C15_12745 [Frigoribacterium sp. NBH87]|uniref:hypothetical protein n=1 Tax=Frigoribacterium sp. NBH87 TaxID=2596916 RepID=UPI001629A348|nr:hypothetical protein [Frigoribacterium sp. NBH87]QNE44566.1 hypothetical protein F1C15_12745 [Frigoribacterium sp. NBH87]